MYLYTSQGIGRIDGLDVFLGEPARLYRAGKRTNASAVVGWGCKPTTQKARKLAARLGL
jgi:capsule polysaccharide export protein KpsC/LpsZ